MAPLIGITTHPDNDIDRANLDKLLAQIIHGVELGGGVPVLIPLYLSDATLRALYARLDGLLVPGGGDVAPTLYGAPMHPSIAGLDAERDRTEKALIQWAVQEAKPLFGICRGAQLLNVTLGGTLYQDIASEHVAAVDHNFHADRPFDYRSHAVRVEEESRLAAILGEPITQVNSMHHQAVRVVAPPLRAVALAPDGLVEAIELAAHPFALAVQWHPESLTDTPAQLNLFKAFVQACQQ